MKYLIGDKCFLLTTVFWTLIVSFFIEMSYLFIPMDLTLKRSLWPFFVILSIISFFLGVALIFLTLKEKIKGWLKNFLLLMGISIIGMPVSVILHNLIYGLFIYLFGQGFWEKINLSDEPVFFILAVIVFPIGFLIGITGSIAVLSKQKK